MEKISVLLCVKNGEDYIKQSVESILNQTYSNFELIIVVNCSIDNTLDIVKSFDDSRIKIIKSGICQLNYNLNLALSYAEGEYIARMDADDIAKKDRFEKQLKILEEKNIDIVGSNIEYIDENGKVIGQKIYPEYDQDIRRQIFYKAVIVHPSIMCRKSLLLKVGGYLGGKYAQDLDLWLRLMRDKNIKFYNIQEPLLQYRVHSNQAKGDNLAYADVAGYMLRESIYSRSFKYFIGAWIYYIKAFAK